MRKLGYLAAAAVLIAASAQPAVADEDGYRRHRHHQHHRHHHRSHRHYGVNVTYGTPRYALPPYCCDASVVVRPGLPAVVYGPPIFPDPTELEPSYLVDQVPTGTYPLGQFRDPALFHSPYEYPYVRSGYIAYAYESRRIRRPSYRRDHEFFNDFR
jgi:hypothetical protein